jgi:transposase
MRLSNEDRGKIREAFRKTGTIRGTKRLTGVSRKAIRRELDQRGGGIPAAPAVKMRTSKLDPYKPKISVLVNEKKLTAVLVLDEIRVLGYTGGYSILKDYIRTLRPQRMKIPRPPIDHPPGYEGQMDWSPHNVIIGGRPQVVHTGSIVLCYSRWLFIRHFVDETLEHVILLHEQAFKELQAVPDRMTYDNMTTVGRHIGPGEVWLNPQFKRFADEYGFEVVILPPGAKERHGKVERPFHYIENNFLLGREFADLAELNEKADQWRWNKANVRIHGTLRQRPVDRLQRERPYLKPLSAHLSDVVYKEVDRKINVDFCVAVDTKRYSANPHLIGKTAKVRLYREHLEIWVDGKLDCKHGYTSEERSVLPEHEALYKAMTGQRRLLEEAFMRLGAPAKSYYEGLQKTRKAAAGYHLQRILQYAERYGSDVVAGALAYAESYGAFSAEAVLRIVSGKKIKTEKKSVEAKVPENVRQFLRAYAVEKQQPDHYDELLKEEVDEKRTP